MILLHLDLPAWNNAGGLIILPALVALIGACVGSLNPNRHNNQRRDQ